MQIFLGSKISVFFAVFLDLAIAPNSTVFFRDFAAREPAGKIAGKKNTTLSLLNSRFLFGGISISEFSDPKRFKDVEWLASPNTFSKLAVEPGHLGRL